MSSNLMDTEPGGEQTQYEAEHTDVLPHAKLPGQLGGKNPSLTKEAASKPKDDSPDSDNSRDSTIANKLAGGQQTKTTTKGISPLANPTPAKAPPAIASALAKPTKPALTRTNSSPVTTHTHTHTHTISQTCFADASPPLATSSSTASPPLSVSVSNSSSFAKHMLQTWVADVKAGSQMQKGGLGSAGAGSGTEEAEKARREQGYGGERDMRRDVGA